MSGKLQHMRKERTLRKILQTKIQQQIKSEKTNRRKKQKNETKHLASQAKYSLHKKTIEEKNKHYTAMVKINGIKKEFTIDTGSR